MRVRESERTRVRVRVNESNSDNEAGGWLRVADEWGKAEKLTANVGKGDTFRETGVQHK